MRNVLVLSLCSVQVASELSVATVGAAALLLFSLPGLFVVVLASVYVHDL